MDPALMSALELLDGYRSRRLSPVEATKAVLDRIDRAQPHVNAFCHVDRPASLKAARESELRWRSGQPIGLVDGVPTTVKAVANFRGWPTLRGSRAVSPRQSWSIDAPVVSRLREQGAIFVGMTTTPEFGWKGVTDSPLTGVTRNPWNTSLTPGGSSGGAAVAAALGLGTLNIGSDGGGSIRIPSAFTGVFGLKPTFGRVPAWPRSGIGTLSHYGPITRCVEDAALMLDVISQPDRRDWLALPPDAPYLAALGNFAQIIPGLRIGICELPTGHAVAPELSASVSAVGGQLAAAGAHVQPVELSLAGAVEAFELIWATGCAAGVMALPEEARAVLDPGLRIMAERMAGYSAFDRVHGELLRERLGHEFSLLHEKHDILIMPVLPIFPFEAGHDIPPGSGLRDWWEWNPFTYPFNLTQQPAASLPCGLSKNGLPLAVQLIGPRMGDLLVLQVCRFLEGTHRSPLPSLDAITGGRIAN